MKKIVSVALVLIVLAISLLPGITSDYMNVQAAETDYKCGENAAWSLDTKTGVLKIEGTGRLYSYTTEVAPWRKYSQYITSMVIGEGITYIGNGAFTMLNYVTSLSLPSTLEEIWADASLYALETISISENSNLRFMAYTKFASGSKWYAALPDKSPVYIGSFLMGFKGTVSENISVNIDEGTKAINRNAFKNIANITEIGFPESLEHVGVNAFEGTGWLASHPDGAVYAGKVLYSYKGIMSLDESDFVVKNGTVSITENALYDNDIINSVTFPESLETIGTQAFGYCSNLTEINFSKNGNLRKIGDKAFSDTAVSKVEFPASVEILGNASFFYTMLESVYIPANILMLDGAFGAISPLERFEVSPDNPNYCADEKGVLFSKDKTVLHYFPSKNTDYEYVVPDGVTYIGAYAFSFSNVERIIFGNDVRATGTSPFYRSYSRTIILNESLPVMSKYMFNNDWGTYYLTVPESVKTIETGALGYHLDYVYFKGKDVTFDDEQWYYSQKMKFFCYKDSTAYEYAKANSEKLTAIILDDENIGDYGNYEYAVNKFRSLSSERFSHYAYWNTSAVISNFPLNISRAYQSEINSAVDIINEAFDTMRIKWADYSAVDEAIERAEAVDRAMFTDESLEKLDKAVNAVERYCDVADEKLIEEYVENIDNAIVLLDEKAGDYSALNSALENAKNTDRSLYTENSLQLLDEAIYAAENAEKTDDQNVINAYTKAIEDAILNLSYKSADYSSIEDAVEIANGINRNLYTPESLAKLDEAVNAVDYGLTIDKQSEIKEWTDAIESAIENLEYLPADYSAVESEIEKAEKLDRRYYSEISLIALDAAINAVEYNLDITHQSEVNSFAKAISDAISALQYASVVLRHEPCGVIVSATTKEIKPNTILAVEEVDPSNYEGTNFAVGGSIRSLSFYDINLVYETVVVQPDGTVTVKIKLKDGVDPAKCKVYHVTEDIVNPLVRFASTIDGNYIVFETSHFSEFAVIEVETVLDSIEVSACPEKTVYHTGEQLDLTGMRVVAHYSDGASKEITDYIVGMVDMDSAGPKKVVVYYTYGDITKSSEFNITVIGKTDDVTDIIIRNPSRTTINYGDSIWLHAEIEGNLPEDAKIVWTPSNNSFEIAEVSADGLSCKITPKSSGTTTFTASVVDAEDKVLSTDTQDMNAKAGLWQKIVAFFKKLFGATKTYPQLYKSLF